MALKANQWGTTFSRRFTIDYNKVRPGALGYLASKENDEFAKIVSERATNC